MVFELSEELGKKIAFTFTSDSDFVPGLKILQPSIFHLIRNGADHGIEDQFERLEAGKSETADLKLSFFTEAGSLRVEVEDDGRGLDFDQIEKKAVEAGILKAEKHFPSQILKAMFSAGFSSRDEASEISGRGVGLDAVRAEMRKLGAAINVRTTKGKGTAFILSIPLKKLEDE